MSIEINNLTNYQINLKIFKKIIKEIIADKNISIALVDKKTIREINKKYRQKDQPTDILSFGQFSEKDPFYTPELIICPDLIENIYQVLIHGLLHLLGHDHEKSKKQADIMRKIEKQYLKKYE